MSEDPFASSHSRLCISPGFRSIKTAEEARKLAPEISYPAIVKPTDSAGSKGVRKVENATEVAEAVEYALSFSLSGECLIEEFLEKVGDSSDADGFTVEGQFKSISFSGQRFDIDSKNPYVPNSYVLPAAMAVNAQAELVSELQRLADLLKLGSGIYNIETRVATNGIPYIMEISPRGGGNRLSDFLKYASGVDLIRATVMAAVGISVENLHMPVYDGLWFQEILRSEVPGRFEGIWFDDEFHAKHVKDKQIWIEKGEHVEAFTSANFAFGSVFMRFEDSTELDQYLQDPSLSMKILVTPVETPVSFG